MKKIILTLTLTVIAITLPSAVFAEEKMMVDVYSTDNATEISITVGAVEYISAAAAPEILTVVRVWKGPDSLLYNLCPTGVDYSQSYGNEPKDEDKMTQAQAAKAWASYVKRFQGLKKKIQVSVRFDSAPVKQSAQK